MERSLYQGNASVNQVRLNLVGDESALSPISEIAASLECQDFQSGVVVGTTISLPENPTNCIVKLEWVTLANNVTLRPAPEASFSTYHTGDTAEFIGEGQTLQFTVVSQLPAAASDGDQVAYRFSEIKSGSRISVASGSSEPGTSVTLTIDGTSAPELVANSMILDLQVDGDVGFRLMLTCNIPLVSSENVCGESSMADHGIGFFADSSLWGYQAAAEHAEALVPLSDYTSLEFLLPDAEDVINGGASVRLSPSEVGIDLPGSGIVTRQLLVANASRDSFVAQLFDFDLDKISLATANASAAALAYPAIGD